MRTLFSTTEGVTHEGKESAASIRRNSPSESRMLEKKKLDSKKWTEVDIYLITKSHLMPTSRSNHTTHHSSSIESPTLILPSRNHPDPSLFCATLTWKVSRCHKKSVRRVSTKLWTDNARAVAEVLSDDGSGGYKT